MRKICLLLYVLNFLWIAAILPVANAEIDVSKYVEYTDSSQEISRVYLKLNNSLDKETAHSGSTRIVKRDCIKNYRVAIIQMGPHERFKIMIRAFLIKLWEDGYIDLPASLTQDFDYDNPEVWKEIADASTGSCVHLLKDGYYSAGWDDSDWEKTHPILKKRILEENDVDILMGLGVAAGVQFADSSLGIPVMIVDPSSPEAAGIIGPGKFSDKHNVHVQKYPKREFMTLSSFREIFNFKNLGMIVDSDADIQNAQSFSLIKKIAAEMGINLHYCIGAIHDTSNIENQKQFIRCRDEIIDKIDAVYLPLFNGIPDKNFFSFIRPFVERDIIVISSNRISEVKKGSLITLVEDGIEDSGRFEADVMEKIVDGVLPEKISQNFYTNLSFALNMKTARLVNWKPSFELLMSVTYLFDNIDFN
jgi:ABC-type uncharacterized transport system substrate-binding protein